VGLWEDEDYAHSERVNQYWRAAGKPKLNGWKCQQPWSPAFNSWLVGHAGVSDSQFPPVAAHWVYLARLIEASDLPGRYFVPRNVSTYRSTPGDIICASTEIPQSSARVGQVQPWTLQDTRTHCELVAKTSGRTLEAIGGNVRNSVSRSLLERDADGHLQPVPHRPWFLVLENRL
jgi:hypothetical protein